MSRTTLMPRRLRPTAMKVVLASGVAAACAAGMMVGIAAAAPAGPSRAAHPAALPAVDHHLCYAAKGTYHIPPAVKLFNQFSPKGFAPKIGQPVLHCNPVAKFVGTRPFPITNPAAHLLCFRMTAATQPTPTVFVANQFGTALLATGQPNLLCLPSWKSLRGPPKQKAPQPPGISHFTCYPVTELPGTGGYSAPPNIMLQDQFAKTPVPVTVKPVPAELCLPTEKVVGKKVFRIVNPVPHLLCFPVSQTPNVSPVWDQNQFGTSKITIGATKLLCLPSNKQVVPTPVDHHLCYVARGTYHVPRVKLVNQFSPKGFVPKIGTVAFHCNPVAKTIASTGQPFPITNPAAHLLCFHIFAPRQRVPSVVQVSNQFGSGMLVPGQPNLLCLPTWKGLRAPPKMKVPQPPGLSHFTCYPVHELPGTPGYKPPPVLLQDQFAQKPVPVQVRAVPAELCLPTSKTVGTTTYPIINRIAHLLCFVVTQTPRRTPVFDQNQFGTARIAIGATKWLCLPSMKKIIKP